MINHIILLTSLVLFVGFSLDSKADQADQIALMQLEAFLFNQTARAAWSKNRPDARTANRYLESFPKEIQQEMLEIVMMIMREKKEKAEVHVVAYKKNGASGAMSSFSPEVQSRIKALVYRLKSDPKFNSKRNLEYLKTRMPRIK